MVSGSSNIWYGTNYVIAQAPTDLRCTQKSFNFPPPLMAHNGIPFEQLGPPWSCNAVIALPPQAVMNAPNGTWGVAYDLYQRKIEDHLGSGWAKRRGAYICLLKLQIPVLQSPQRVFTERSSMNWKSRAFIARSTLSSTVRGRQQMLGQQCLVYEKSAHTEFLRLSCDVSKCFVFRHPICLSLQMMFGWGVSTPPHYWGLLQLCWRMGWAYPMRNGLMVLEIGCHLGCDIRQRRLIAIIGGFRISRTLKGILHVTSVNSLYLSKMLVLFRRTIQSSVVIFACDIINV